MNSPLTRFCRRGLVASLALLLACSPKEPASTDSGSTTSASATSTSTTSTAATDGETDATTTSAGPTTSVSTAATTGGGACACGPDEYCDFVPNTCGEIGEGTCQPRPQGCDLVYAPVCGCDGEVYGNTCGAASEGVDVGPADACTPPEGYLACGFQFCDQTIAYCEASISDVVDEPSSFSCKPIPPACDPPDCACLETEPCGDLCEQLPAGGFVLTCPGG